LLAPAPGGGTAYDNPHARRVPAVVSVAYPRRAEGASLVSSHPLIPWLAGKRPVRVAVVGDVMLDEYLDGAVSRISPEAPVPVHLVTKQLHGAGGAANVARNIKLAGGEVMLLSVLGNDEAGRQLKTLLQADRIETAYLQVVQDRPTIRKTRISAASHQIVRVDWERVHPIAVDVQERISNGLRSIEFDALLISDYGKGALPASLLTKLLDLARSRGVPAVVDPKGRDYGKYLHATLITPNRKEACEALGLDPADDFSGEDLGRRLQSTFGLENVLVTLGPKGMVLVPKEPNEPATVLPAVAREVFDVSGAGDTAVAVMTLSLAARAPMPAAMHIANTAAALVVEKWGTQPIQLQELESALRERPDPRRAVYSTSSKVQIKENLRLIVKDQASRHKKVVFTNGCFDLLHAGHVAYLEEARSLGDLLVVGVNSDASVRRLKGAPRPFVSADNRMRLLAALSCVDYVVGFDEDTPKLLIDFLVPDVLVKGADWDKGAAPGTSGHIVGSETVRGAGGTVETVPYPEGLSTTALVEYVRRG
jgi:D-beta-D-heptose 7-phosphate kinase/D-beta-D-heptose 1-phosphate adenosyltransferase